MFKNMNNRLMSNVQNNEQTDVQSNVQNNEMSDVQSNVQNNVQSDLQSNGQKMNRLMYNNETLLPSPCSKS